MTDKQFGDMIKNMVVIVDTREQKNEHILTYFEVNNIKYKIDKLDFGDYSFELTGEYSKLNRSISVEKKNSLNEICGNFTKGRDRFEREFERAKNSNAKLHLLIENATWKKIVNESYRSKISYKSLMASILCFSDRFNSPVWFVGKDESPMLIYNILYYGVKEKLKEVFNV